jgi:hypothetical protein
MHHVIQILILIFRIIQVTKSQCLNLLTEYYACNCLQNISIASPSLDNSFYERHLASINNFDSAMDFFKSIYTKSSTCQPCLRKFPHHHSNYSFLFLNPAHFQSLKRIIADIRSSYPISSYEQITEQTPAFSHLFANQSSHLNKFCIAYDYSSDMFIFFPETLACAMRINDERKAKCVYDNLFYNQKFFTTHSLNFSLYSSEDLALFAKCMAKIVRTCPLDIQRVIVLNVIVEFPQIIEEDGQDLVEFIDSLLYTASSGDKIGPQRDIFECFSFILMVYFLIKQVP